MKEIKKSTLWKNICVGSALFFALVALMMIFFEMVCHTETGVGYKGYEIAFTHIEWNGLKDTLPPYNTVDIVWSFSFPNFFGYLCLLLGIICSVAALAYKKQGLILAVFTMLLFIMAGISFLGQVDNLEPFTRGLREWYSDFPGMKPNDINAKVNEYIVEVRSQHQLSWAAIVAAVCSFLAAVAALLSKIMWQYHHNQEK